jgi:HlyD family secretion protein
MSVVQQLPVAARLPATAKANAATPHMITVRKGIGRHLLVGGVAFCGIVFGLGGLAATIDFAGAIVAPGQLVVDSNVKKVQHPQGGTVTEILIRDGAKVKAGDLLARLDPTLAAANLGIVSKGLDEQEAKKARLAAERDGAQAIEFPAEFTARASTPEIAELIAIETGLFASRREAREGQKQQLRKKISEFEQQAVGIKAQEDAVRRMIALTAKELEGLRSLNGRDLVPADRMNAVERQAAQLDGQLGQLISSTAQIGAEIAQAELQILQIDQEHRSEVGRELSDAGSKINELTEKKIAAEDQLRKLEIRAPLDGTVHQLAIHTVGGVVNPGEPMMLVVPENDRLVVETRVDPSQIDRLQVGSEATLRFTNFNQRETPEFLGKVESVSPDIVVDQRSGMGFFVVRVLLPPGAVEKLGQDLVPGMPVEVFVGTGERTVLSYLVRPLTDQIMHTFRER